LRLRERSWRLRSRFASFRLLSFHFAARASDLPDLAGGLATHAAAASPPLMRPSSAASPPFEKPRRQKQPGRLRNR
jgi:hypothetical protein